MSYLEAPTEEVQKKVEFEQRSMEKAIQRLNQYISNLKNHILTIV